MCGSLCAIDEGVGATDAGAGAAPPGGDGSDLAVSLRLLVEAHSPGDPREVASRERFLAELDRLERPFDEEADPVHVTASAVVVGRRGTVLHLHRRLGRWLQPGGHVDPGEAPEAAALRETWEETGLAVSHPADGPRLIHLDVHEAARGHVHLDLRYLLVGPDADPAPLPGESPDVRWCSWVDAETMADAALAGALRAARDAWDGTRLGGTGDGGPDDA
jgi:8-oxo-dGTP pyrophosphatase MutT (NUDIX family)